MEKLSYAKGVVFRKEPGGGILFNIDTGDLQITEETAFGICDMIDRGAGRIDILKKLEELYPLENNLERDLDEFLDQLREKGVLA